MILFGIDAASYQGNVDWAAADTVIAFGFEKVTQGTSYVNPYWAKAKTAMNSRAKASGFLPGAYLFLEAGDGAAQADWFTQHAGNLDGWAIVVDVEPSGTSRPTITGARNCCSRLRHHYPASPIGGYPPRWYLGSADETFWDWTWASDYVTGSGAPADLYAKVTADMWAAYGGMTPTLLQFTNQAIVPGVTGYVDCSAFRGTAAELRAVLLGGTMALTAADAKTLLTTDGIIENPIPKADRKDATNEYVTMASALELIGGWAYHARQDIAALKAALDPDTFAASVAAKLPGVESAQVVAAVKEALREGTGTTPAG